MQKIVIMSSKIVITQEVLQKMERSVKQSPIYIAKLESAKKNVAISKLTISNLKK